MRAKPVLEALSDVLQPRSKEDIFQELKRKEPEDMFNKGLWQGNLKAVKYAVEKYGLNPDGSWANDSNKNWTIYSAVRKGYVDIVKYLIKNGVSPDVKYNKGFRDETPLLLNTKEGNEEIFDILAKNVKDLSYPNNWPFHKAAVNGYVGIVKKLLKDKNVKKHLKTEQTPRHHPTKQMSTLQWINRMIIAIKNGVKKKAKIEDLEKIKKLIEDAQKN